MELGNPDIVPKEESRVKFISRVCVLDRLTFTDSSQMAAIVRAQLLWAGSASHSRLFDCLAGRCLFIKMFLYTSVRFVTPDNKLRAAAWCQLWLLHFWKIPDVSGSTPGDCWRLADNIWTPVLPHRSLNMHAVYFGMGVLLIVLIFEKIDFLLTYQWLKTHPTDYIKVCSVLEFVAQWGQWPW